MSCKSQTERGDDDAIGHLICGGFQVGRRRAKMIQPDRILAVFGLCLSHTVHRPSPLLGSPKIEACDKCRGAYNLS